MNRKYGYAAAAVLLAVSLTGCLPRKYEKIDLPEATLGSSAVTASVTAETSGVMMAGTTEGAGQAGPAGSAEPGKAPGQEAPTQAAETTAPQKPVTFEACEETVYVDATSLNLRTSPSMDAETSVRVERGAALRRTGRSEEWSRVIYEEKEYYAAAQYLTTEKPAVPVGGEVSLNPEWKYADYAKISSGKAVLYRSEASDRKGKVVCVNAGHGTSGGESVKTQCHPDGTAKVTGGTTGKGATTAVAVSGGMTFADGTAEAKVTLAMAMVLKEKLLARGYDVLMIRETNDVQLDNIARTVLANNLADCHIALHWDSTERDKGAFFMSVPNVSSYRAMEPVASHWQQHHALGDSLIAGLKGAGVKIFSDGRMEMDLTQTSYSTVPSVDIELGDKVSDHSAAALDKLGNGLADGVELFFGA